MVPLTPKAFETLLLLVSHQGSIVTKQKILDTLWPNVFVEESNITFNITKLRKALGDTTRPAIYIETVPRRGYRFKSEVKEVLTADDTQMELGSSDSATEREQLQLASEISHQSPAEVFVPITSRFSAFRLLRKTSVLLLVLLTSLIAVIGVVATWRFNRKPLVQDSRAGKQPILVSPPPSNLNYEQITTYGNVVSAAISPDAKQVVYVQENSDQQSVWLIQLATHVRSQLIPPADHSYNDLCFSHDGNYIYFTRHGENQPTELYRIPTLNGPPIRVLSDVEGVYSLSPDDRGIVFRRRNLDAREDSVYFADLDSGQETALITHKAPDWIRALSLSPDGKTVVYATGETDSGRQTMTIAAVDVATGQAKVLLKPNWYVVRQVEWLPDGRGLLVCARENTTSNAQIWRMSYPEGALRKLTNDLNNYLWFSVSADASKMIAVESTLASHIWVSPNVSGNKAKNVADGRGPPVWTADGKIIYTAASVSGSDLWTSNPDGTDPKQLSFNAGDNDWPTVAPANRIVFHSNRTGSQHLFRMDADGSNQIQLTNGYAERNATVSPDGKWVYYNASETSLLWKIPLEGGQPIQLTNEYAAYPSISPDGKLVACFHFPKYGHEGQITVRSTEDMKTVSELTLAPGFWISRSIRWEADSSTLIYAIQNESKVKLYRQSINGGEPRELTSLKAEDEFEFSFSPDHKQLAFVSTKWNHDAVLIDGFK